MSKIFKLILNLVERKNVKMSNQDRFVACCFGHCLQAGSKPVVKRFYEKESMRTRHHTKLIHEGQYVAEVDIQLIDTDEGWAPYLSLDDAEKLDDVRDALRRGDVKTACRLARIFNLTPVAA